jgi:hypothetical protein
MERYVLSHPAVRLGNPLSSRTPPNTVGPPYVVIVSKNPATIRALEAYLRTAGVPTHSGRALRAVEAVTLARATAAVLFPDDLRQEGVTAFVRRLREVRPRLLVVLVTRQPQRFVSIVQADGRSLPPLVLPRPSFGWDILEAIRSYVNASQEPA